MKNKCTYIFLAFFQIIMLKNGFCQLCQLRLKLKAEHLRHRWFQTNADVVKESRTKFNVNIQSTAETRYHLTTVAADTRLNYKKTAGSSYIVKNTIKGEYTPAKPLRPVKGKSSENPVKRFVDWTEVGISLI